MCQAERTSGHDNLPRHRPNLVDNAAHSPMIEDLRVIHCIRTDAGQIARRNRRTLVMFGGMRMPRTVVGFCAVGSVAWRLSFDRGVTQPWKYAQALNTNKSMFNTHLIEVLIFLKERDTVAYPT